MTVEDVLRLLSLPFNDLLYRAHTVHRQHFDPNGVQLSTLLSIKTGACPEDCAYCPQSARHRTGLAPEPLMDREQVLEAARKAKAKGATRFCMGGAFRSPRDKDIEKILPLVEGVRALGLETCLTLGMLTLAQARRLKAAGLDYYNHNLDTSREYYPAIISTRTYEERLETLRNVREVGLKVCCGGIVGMGEGRKDRARLLFTLATLPEPPESVPINLLVRIPGTPLENAPPLDPFELVRTIAAARILMPQSFVRLSAGREGMSDELQALCLFAGANALFFGDRLLTAPNASTPRDRSLFERLGLHPIS